MKSQRVGQPARRFDSQFAPAGLGIGSQGNLHRDAVGQGRLRLPSHELGAGSGELLVDLENIFQGLGIIGIFLPQLVELFLQCLRFLHVQVPDVLPHGGLDAVPGEVGLQDVDLIVATPGTQKLPADRHQKRRSLSAAGRKDIANSWSLLSRCTGYVQRG